MISGIFQLGVPLIGLDLGASGAKLLQLDRSRGRPRVIASARIEAAADDPADEGHIAAMATLLERRVRSAGFRGRRCVIGVDDRLLRVRSIRQQRMNNADTDQALRVDAAERLGFERDDPVEIGWLRAGEIHQQDEVREEILLVGARATVLERIVDAVLRAGLEPVALEPGFVACARTFALRQRRDDDARRAQIIVDIGRRSTSVLALRGQALAFQKRLDWGGADLDEAAAQRLDLDPVTVGEIRRQRLRRQWGAATNETPLDERIDRAVFDAVRPLLNDLAHEVTLCLRYFMVTFRGSKPETVQLVGGDACEPRLAEIVSSIGGVPARIGKPLEGIDLAGCSLAGNRRGPLSEWATAAGLSLRPDRAFALPDMDKVRALLKRTTRREAAA